MKIQTYCTATGCKNKPTTVYEVILIVNGKSKPTRTGRCNDHPMWCDKSWPMPEGEDMMEW